MKKVVNGIEVEESAGNVFADLGLPDAEELQVKAQLAGRIGEVLRARGLTQIEGAALLGLTQPKLSGLLRGQLRGISETKLMDCLCRLGYDVQIVIGPLHTAATPGRVEVVAA